MWCKVYQELDRSLKNRTLEPGKNRPWTPSNLKNAEPGPSENRTIENRKIRLESKLHAFDTINSGGTSILAMTFKADFRDEMTIQNVLPITTLLSIG